MSNTEPKNKGKLVILAQSASPTMLRRKTTKYARMIDSLHMLRDGFAALHIYSVLKELYDFGEVLLNLPPNVYAEEGPEFEPYPNLSERDLILLCTRPALDDTKDDKRNLPRSGSVIEKMIFGEDEEGNPCGKGICSFFNHLSRKYIILSNEIASKINDQEAKTYRGIEFHVNYDSFYCRRGNVKHIHALTRATTIIGSKSTLGYIVYIPNLKNEKGKKTAGVLSIFGLNGTATLLFAKLLSLERPELLLDIIKSKQPRLIGAEFTPTFSDKRRPSSLSFSSSNNLKIRVDAKMDI